MTTLKDSTSTYWACCRNLRPLLGQHTAEVLGKLDLSPDALAGVLGGPS